MSLRFLFIDRTRRSSVALYPTDACPADAEPLDASAPSAAAFRSQAGFTLAELFSATLLTLLFFGWLTYAYLSVVKAVTAWQEQWALAGSVNRIMDRMTRDLEEAVSIDSLSASYLACSFADGRPLIYTHQDSAVWRNGRSLVRPEIRVVTLTMTRLEAEEDPLTGGRRLQEGSPEKASDGARWLRVKITGLMKDRHLSAEQTVRLYRLRPAILRAMSDPS